MTLVQSELNVDLSVGSWNCPNDDPKAFKQLIGRFDNVDVARVTINFDMTKNHISKLVGLSATIKQDGWRRIRCKPINKFNKQFNKLVLKSMLREPAREPGLMSLSFACPKFRYAPFHANSVEINLGYRSAHWSYQKCPTFESFEVLTEEDVAESKIDQPEWSEWTEWSECSVRMWSEWSKWINSKKSRSRDCTGFGCPYPVQVDLQRCN